MEITDGQRSFLRRLLYVVEDAEKAIADAKMGRIRPWQRRWRRVQREAHGMCEMGVPVIEDMLEDYFDFCDLYRNEWSLTQLGACEAAEALVVWLEAAGTGEMLSETLRWERAFTTSLGPSSYGRELLRTAIAAGEALGRWQTAEVPWGIIEPGITSHHRGRGTRSSVVAEIDAMISVLA